MESAWLLLSERVGACERESLCIGAAGWLRLAASNANTECKR